MDKKAVSHVDWIIAASIFFVYLALVFTFFKPGVMPVFNPEDLLDIVESNFVNASKAEIYTVPVFLHQINYKVEDNYIVTPNGLVKVTLNKFNEAVPLLNEIEGLGITGVFFVPRKSDHIPDDNKKYKISEEERESKKIKRQYLFYLGGSNSEPEFLSFNIKSFTAPNGIDKIEYLTILSKETGTVLGITLRDFLSDEDSPPIGIVVACNDAIGEPSLAIKDEEYISDGNCQARYEVGAIEKIEGIYPDVGDFAEKIYNLNKGGGEDNDDEAKPCGGLSSSYDCVKKIWNFPDLKDFRIVIYEKGINKIKGKFPDVELPTDVNIYTRHFNSYMLNEDGTRDAVTVSIQVW